MKKFFEKNSLIKVATIMLIISVVLTWIIKVPVGDGTYQYHRAGIIDFFSLITIGLEVFSHFATLLFITAGFYELLSRTKGYQIIVEKFSSKFKKSKEKSLVFSIITMLVFTLLSSVFIDPMALILFAPFFITLILKMGKDKITALFATFGGILIGTIGSLYSSPITGQIIDSFSVKSTDKFIYRIAVLIVVYLAGVAFLIIHNLKQKKSEKVVIPELFEVKAPKSTDKGCVGIGIILLTLFILVILGFFPWGTILSSEWTQKLYDGYINFKIGGVKIFDSLIGPKVYDFSLQFGNWSMITAQAVVLAVSILIALFSKINVDEFIDSFLTGFKKVGKPVLIIILAYLVMLISLQFPVLIGLTEKLLPKFNYFVSAILAFFGSLFGVEFRYVLTLTGNQMLQLHPENINPSTLGVIFQTVYGFVQFFAPTSLFLLVGLSTLEISYSEWLKKSWMFIAATFVITLATIILVTQL